MAEGAPLLREYGSKAHRGFESLSLRQYTKKAPLKAGLFLYLTKIQGSNPRVTRSGTGFDYRAGLPGKTSMQETPGG